ncbi:hypothetical protein J2S46_007163 [Kitasatospora herbaricolor]|nr:hypothetical protein [Kitasatospora herbaricolor]
MTVQTRCGLQRLREEMIRDDVAFRRNGGVT